MLKSFQSASRKTSSDGAVPEDVGKPFTILLSSTQADDEVRPGSGRMLAIFLVTCRLADN